MEVFNILKGHYNELLGKNEDISNRRLQICYKCPLYKNILGGICNSNLWYNSNTGDVSDVKKDGYVNGCGCRLSSKTRVITAKCPNGKW